MGLHLIRSINRIKYDCIINLTFEQNYNDLGLEVSNGRNLFTNNIDFVNLITFYMTPLTLDYSLNIKNLSLDYYNVLYIAYTEGFKNIIIPFINETNYNINIDYAFDFITQGISSFFESNDDESLEIYLYVDYQFKNLDNTDLLDFLNNYDFNIYRKIDREFNSVFTNFSESIYDCDTTSVDVDEELTNIEVVKESYNDESPQTIVKPKILKAINSSNYDINDNLKKIIENKDIGFVKTLFNIIDTKGLSDPEVYKKASLDRKIFSKIRSASDTYVPKKTTALSLCIALELDINETESLLKKAGLSLSNSFKFDIVVKYFIENKIFDVFKINSFLYRFNLDLLGN
jgi:hypothetical protein